MRITAIKAQVRNPERISVYVDGKYSFSLSQSQLLESKIYSGLDITEEKLAELKQASDYGKMLERVINYVMIRPRSVCEVRDYLRLKKADPEMADKIIPYLQNRRYLDDGNFAASWVRSRQLTKPVSKRRLIAELRQKGVAPEIITQAIDHDEYDEQAALQEIIAKKRKQTRYQDEQKLTAYLVRQGFGYDMVKFALNQTQAGSSA